MARLWVDCGLAAGAAAALAWAAVEGAEAQSQFQTPNGSSVSGAVTMCLDSTKSAVPCPQGSGSGQSAVPTNYSLESGGNLAALLARTPPTNAAGQSPVADPNNAALAGPGAPFAVGATVQAGRALLADCSQAGRLTLLLSGSQSQVPYQVAAATQVLPLAVTQVVSAGGAACTYQNFYQ